MTDTKLVFDDGASYERMMGAWSRLVGDAFLHWLAPANGQIWLDVGCGNGAFSELVFAQCPPARLDGVDPSEGQIDYARKRLAGRPANFVRGDAIALPFADGAFDKAVMALVIFFVSDPPQAVREMARVLRPGGVAAAYAWHIAGGGAPVEPIYEILREMGFEPPHPPRRETSELDTLRALWAEAGFSRIETKVIDVRRRFANFEEYWSVSSVGPVTPLFAALGPERANEVKERVRAKLKFDASGEPIFTARAHAVKGAKI